MIKDWNNIPPHTKIRVVFYGRVSTENPEQKYALGNQQEWYSQLLEQHKADWVLARPMDTYIDDGVTGTRVEIREKFLSMIEDARTDVFDMIVTREVSRFSRNTEQALKYVRILKEAGVAVYFVHENIHTMREDSAFRFTMMASIAQEESQKLGARVKYGQDAVRKNEKEYVLYGNGNVLGYDRIRRRSDIDKRNALRDKSVPTFAVNEEQAETVRMIYDLYLQGYGLKRIKAELESRGRLTASGKVHWHEATITRILENPMYIGKQYQNKQNVKGFASSKRTNNPRSEYVLLEGDFEPILSEEVYYAVQKLKETKEKFGGHKDTAPEEREERLKWQSKLECACGSMFKRFRWHSATETTGESIGYECRHRALNGSEDYRIRHNIDVTGACSLKSVPEWHLELMGLLVLHAICKERRDSIMEGFELIEQHYTVEQDYSQTSIGSLKNKIANLKKKIDRAFDLYTDGDMTREEYKERRGKLDDELADLQGELQAEEERKAYYERGQKDIRYDDLFRILEAMGQMFDFRGEKVDPALVSNFVDRIVMKDNHTFVWMISLEGDAENFPKEEYQYKPNTPIEERRKLTEKMLEEEYRKLFDMRINYDTARGYRKEFGKYLRENQWDDIDVVVYGR